MSNGFYPKALVKNIRPGANDPAIKPRLAILHVDAGNAFSLFDFFSTRSGGVESHFHVRADGVVEQYRSIYFQADANLNANDYAVSIETQGFGTGEWNSKQIAAIKELLLWLNAEAGIPLRVVQRPDGSGVGYHVLFGAPGPWTPVAKTCPGPARVRQFNDVFVPWFRELANPAPRTVETRGAMVDKAIRVTRQIKGGAARLAAKRAALKALRSIPKFRKAV